MNIYTLLKNILITGFFLLVATLPAAPNFYGGQGLYRTWSGETVGNGKFSMGLGALISNDGTIIDGKKFTTGNTTTEYTELVMMSYNLFVVFGLSNYADIGVTIPTHIDRLTYISPPTGNAANNLSKSSKFALGDIKVWGKLQYPPYEHSNVFEMAIFVSATAPTGANQTGVVRRDIGMTPQRGGDGIFDAYTAGQVTGEGMMLWTLNLAALDNDIPLKFHLNYGLRTSLTRDFENVFLLRSGVEFAIHPNFTLFTELSADSRFSQFEETYDPFKDPFYLSPGIIINTPQGFTFTLAADFGQSSRDPNDADSVKLGELNTKTNYQVFPTHSFGVGAVIAWTGFLTPQDIDGDGLVDDEDMCPKEAEDMDDFEDQDGCPEDDNDNDEILDLNDKCPNSPEDMDGFEDEDGCPEIDNDKDGINDNDDKCPLIPEDRNNFEDEDGCPDSGLDSDKDGIVDLSDRCPNEPEDKDAFEDFDGCPELDNDKDGFLDEVDKCPNAAEVKNGFEDEDGCPDVKPKPVMEKKAKIVLKNVNFASGSAKLTDDSFEALDKIVVILRENPDVELQITGYTDNRGSDKLNKKLSGKRAQSVVEYFVSKGISSSRLKSFGKGKENPIASNKTAEGRAENRRIEMYRIK